MSLGSSCHLSCYIQPCPFAWGQVKNMAPARRVGMDVSVCLKCQRGPKHSTGKLPEASMILYTSSWIKHLDALTPIWDLQTQLLLDIVQCVLFWLTSFEHLLPARCYATCFTWTISLQPPWNLVSPGKLWASCHRWEHWGWEKLIGQRKITQLVSSRVGIWTLPGLLESKTWDLNNYVNWFGRDQKLSSSISCIPRGCNLHWQVHGTRTLLLLCQRRCCYATLSKLLNLPGHQFSFPRKGMGREDRGGERKGE